MGKWRCLSCALLSSWLAFGLSQAPFGAKLYFIPARDGNTEIYTMDSEGSNQTRLTFNEASDTYPVWSPDGRQIVFHSNRDGK